MTAQIMFDEGRAAVRLGARLRAAREKACVSLRELARNLGLRDHTVLIKYERGSTAPSSVRLQAIAHVLGCSAAALLATTDDAVPIIHTVDHADAGQLAQLSFILETITSAPPALPHDI